MVANFPRGLILAALLIGAAVAAWYGLLRRGFSRIAGLGLGAALVLAAVLIGIDGFRAFFKYLGSPAPSPRPAPVKG